MNKDLELKSTKEEQEKGASMVEYALLVALIAIVAIAAVQILGSKVSSRFSQVASAF